MIAKKMVKSLKSDWEAQKARFKVKYPALTDADLNFDESKKFQMLNKLQVKLGKTTKELQVIIGTL